jgi:manganese transport protein
VQPEDVVDHDAAPIALPGELRVNSAAIASLEGDGKGLKRFLPFLGPAFVASVAYVDPGNFATNISAGAKFGYALLWVIVSANLIAMVVQSLSAKLGIATGRNLAEVCRDQFGRTPRIFLWLQAELIAIATDIAEFLGAAIAINLLFRIPLLPAGIITAIIAFGILALQQRGVRHFEAVIAGFVGVILLAFGAQVVLAQPNAADVAKGLIPSFQGKESVLLAVGIIGATVMPHVIYLHSSLTQHRVIGRSDDERKRIFRFEVVDVVIALGLAGVINAAMLITAGAVLHDTPLAGVGNNLGHTASALGNQLGSHANILFGVALLASGLSSSSVGTLSGQVVMQGFMHLEVPLFLRRAVTMLPALVILAVGVNPTVALVISQVVLSFGIPFALIPLLWFSTRRDLMGSLVNRTSTTIIATLIATVIVGLNILLLYLTFTGTT